MLKEVQFPPHRRFKSGTDWEPIGFFSDCLCNASQFDLMLGFFSSSAINILADGFASFLYNGGRMNLIVNDILTEQDKKAIANGDHETPIPFFDITDIEKLKIGSKTRSLSVSKVLKFFSEIKVCMLNIMFPLSSL